MKLFDRQKKQEINLYAYYDHAGIVRHLEDMARQAVKKDIRIPSSVRGIHCSFSGGESAAQRLLAGGAEKNEIAYGVYDLLARTLGKLFANVIS